MVDIESIVEVSRKINEEAIGFKSSKTLGEA